MSRTFHTSSGAEKESEMIMRRVMRANRYVRENADLDEIFQIIIIRELTQKSLQRIMGTSTGEKKYRNTIHTIHDDMFEAYHDGTFIEKYPHLNEKEAHPIFSTYTERKISTLTEYNPELTEVYISRGGSDIPLLTYDPSPEVHLTKKQIHELRIKLWGMIYSLLPPKEVQETIEYVIAILKKIVQAIQNIKNTLNSLGKI